jgi:hypothetical protein
MPDDLLTLRWPRPGETYSAYLDRCLARGQHLWELWWREHRGDHVGVPAPSPVRVAQAQPTLFDSE